MLKCGTDEIVLNHARMQALGKPPKRDFLAFFNWYHKHPQLAIGYDDFIYHADDFLSMSGSHSNFFEGFLRGHLKHWPMFLKVGRNPRDNTSSATINKYIMQR